MATIYVTENGNYFDKHDIERAMEIVFGIDRDNVEYYFYDKIDDYVDKFCPGISYSKDMSPEDLLCRGKYALALRVAREENPKLSFKEIKELVDSIKDKINSEKKEM